MAATSSSRRCRSCGRFKAAGAIGDLCASCAERLRVEVADEPRPVEPPPPPPNPRPVLEPGVVIARPSQLHHAGSGVLRTLGSKSPAEPEKAPRLQPPLASMSVRERLMLVVAIGLLAGIVVAFLLSR